MGRPTKYKRAMCQTVLDMMELGASKVEVCVALGITRQTLNQWSKDPSKQEFVDALERGSEWSEAWWTEKGRTSLYDRNFNHALWYMNMKNRFGWKDKTEHSGDPKQPFVVQLSESDARL